MKKFENSMGSLDQVRSGSRALSSLSLPLSVVVLFIMFHFVRSYSKHEIFVITNDMEKMIAFLCFSVIVLIANGIYNSIAVTYLYIIIDRLKAKIEEIDKNNEVIMDEIKDRTKDLSTVINLFFSTYLRKERHKEESFEKVKDIASKNDIEVPEND